MINDIRYLKIINETNDKIEELYAKIIDTKKDNSWGFFVYFVLFLISVAAVVASVYFYIWFFSTHEPNILEEQPSWGFTLFPGGVIPLAGLFFAFVFGRLIILQMFHKDNDSKKVEEYKNEIELLKNQVVDEINMFSLNFEKELDSLTCAYNDGYFNLNEYSCLNGSVKYLCDQDIDAYR